MTKKPISLRIRTYQVGFGDCFLLTFQYASDERHVLIDFGSTGLPEGAPPDLMMRIAKSIRETCGGKLHAVVATHRHKDHISGFQTSKGGRGTGDIIASLKPDIVIQPWTEDPDLPKNAKRPASGAVTGRAKKSLAATRVQSLAAMQVLAASALSMSKLRYLDQAVKAELSFLGEDNIANPSAVKNLMEMAPNKYVYYGANCGLRTILPGVDVRVLGPPTLEQESRIAKQRNSDPDEFWHLQQNVSAFWITQKTATELTQPAGGKTKPLFSRHVAKRGSGFPIDARWLVYHARQVQASQALQIVRILDKAMNNTSVILLFEVAGKLLLFPGDAQIENWSFALAKDDVKERLTKVDVYKVGHHGSLNATPKSLWKLFSRRSKSKSEKRRLVTLMSTMAGKHGHVDSDTEVPRRPLVRALESESKHFSTQSLKGETFYYDETIVF